MKGPSAFETVIFDLDGTLADTFPDVSACINRALTVMGREVLTPEKARLAIGPGKEVFLQTILGTDALREEERFLKIFRGFYIDHCLDSTALFPGIETVLAELAPLRLAVATNKPGAAARRILAGLGILSAFSLIAAPENVTRAKPAPDMIDWVLRKTGGRRESALMIGDTDLDIMAGNAAGITTAAALYGYGSSSLITSACPDFSIDRPEELVNIVYYQHTKVSQCV